MQQLRSANSHYARQRRIAALASVAASRAKGATQTAAVVRVHQQAAATAALTAYAAMLAEQGITATAVAEPVPTALVTPAAALLAMLAELESTQALDQLVRTLVPDAGRVAGEVFTSTRQLDGHVRYLNLPSCSRCAILAGRFYRWSDGFLRHPLCDCVMVPSNEPPAKRLIADPMEAFRSGQVRGLSKADTRAINDGADFGQVVNVRRSAAGLTKAGRVFDRAGRPTPEAIYHLASSQENALHLLARHGYIR